MLYNSILPFRPTNVVHQLEPECSLPLLSGRVCFSALARDEMVIWAPMVSHPATLRALLRAATHLKSVIGLCLAPAKADMLELKRTSHPGSFFRSVLEAAADLNYRVPPFFLHVQEPPVGPIHTPTFEAVCKHLSASLDCGFTSFGVDLSDCPETEVIQVVDALFDQILELELAVVVRLPIVTKKDNEWIARLGHSIKKLVEGGIQPDLVLVPGRFEVDDLGRLRKLAMMIAPAGIACNEIGQDFPPASLMSAGLRAVVGDSWLDTLVDRYWDDPERLEALAYVEAADRIEKLGGRGSADRLTSHISGMVNQ